MKNRNCLASKARLLQRMQYTRLFSFLSHNGEDNTVVLVTRYDSYTGHLFQET